VCSSYALHSTRVIIAALNPDGSLQWSNYLPKEWETSIHIFERYNMLGSEDSQPSFIPFPIAELGTGAEMTSALPVYKNGMLPVFGNDAYVDKGKTDDDNLFFISDP
jgi:hypothetical protein